MDSAQRKVSEGEWEQATTLIVASNKNEILMDQFAESNSNAMELISTAYNKGFSIKSVLASGCETVVIPAQRAKQFAPAIIQQDIDE
jgi:hypothetical protein